MPKDDAVLVKKDPRWFYAGLATTVTLLTGASALIIPSLWIGTNASLLGSILVRTVGGLVFSLSAAGLIVANNPRLLFMVSLVRTLRRNKRRGYHHWDEIIPGKVILSAIPAFSHLEELTTPREKGGVGITGVVTVLRDCELGPSFLYRPVQKSEWNNKQVEVLHIEAGDYTPVSVEKLIEGADFIHEKVEKGGCVLIHCKAGKGRSSTVCAVYLIRHEKMTPEKALEFMRSHRPQVHMNKQQWESVVRASKAM